MPGSVRISMKITLLGPLAKRAENFLRCLLTPEKGVSNLWEMSGSKYDPSLDVITTFSGRNVRVMYHYASNVLSDDEFSVAFTTETNSDNILFYDIHKENALKTGENLYNLIKSCFPTKSIEVYLQINDHIDVYYFTNKEDLKDCVMYRNDINLSLDDCEFYNERDKLHYKKRAQALKHLYEISKHRVDNIGLIDKKDFIKWFKDWRPINAWSYETPTEETNFTEFLSLLSKVFYRESNQGVYHKDMVLGYFAISEVGMLGWKK